MVPDSWLPKRISLKSLFDLYHVDSFPGGGLPERYVDGSFEKWGPSWLLIMCTETPLKLYRPPGHNPTYRTLAYVEGLPLIPLTHAPPSSPL